MTHNETSYRKKGRAVVLAALMVLSVVAMSTAFVGGAAADHNGDVIGFDDQVTDGDSVVVNLSSIDTAANLTITNSSGDELYNDSISADDENQSEYEVTLDTAISSSGPLTAHLNASDGSEVTFASADVFLADPSSVDQGPVSYVVDETAGTYEIEIVYSDGDFSGLDFDNVQVTNRSDGDVGVSSVTGTDNQKVTITTDQKLADGSTVDVLGEEFGIETTSSTIEDAAESDEAFAGEDVAIVGDDNEFVEIELPDGTIERQLGPNSGVRTLDTSGYEEGDYINVTYMGQDGETENNTFSLQLEDLGLAASSTQDTYQYAHDEDNTSVEIVGESDVISGVGDFETIVYNSDGDQVESTTGQLDSNAEVRSEFDLKAGNYTAEVVHIDSGITASTGMFTVEQLEELDTSVSFTENQFAQERGDVLSTDISLTNAESISSVQLNVSSDYAAGITVDTSDYDGDEITVYWNTYNAGTGDVGDAGDRFWAVDEDGNELDVDVDGETDIGSNDLPATTYAANLYHNDADRQNRDDSATFNVEERHTGEEAATHIAPAEEYDSSDLEAILDDTTEFDQVATDDILVQSFEVSGVFGQATDVNGVDANAIVDGDTNGIHLNYTSTLDPSFEDPAMFNQSNANVEFVADAENNTIYAVVDTGSVAELAESEDEFEHAWETEFKVSDDYDLASSDETAATSFETVKRSAELDLVESPYQVTPTEDAEIRGTTTLAPGSTVNVEVNMPGVFLHDEDVDIVLEDGELLFNYTNDYSDRSIGEEFEITVDDNNGGDSTTDGIFAETPEWESTESNEELAALLDQHNVSSVEELNMLIAGLEDENGNLTDEVAALEEENGNLSDEVASLEEENGNLSDEITSLEEENGNLSDEITSLEEEIATLEEKSGSDDSGSDDSGSDGDDSDSDDGTPGFGVGIALVALLGAAMLALRRQN